MSDLEERVRNVEQEQAVHRTTLKHIDTQLIDVKQLLTTVVGLQEKQVVNSEALQRAFTAIKDNEERLDRLEGYANRVKGALWLTNGAWVVGVGALTIWLRMGAA